MLYEDGAASGASIRWFSRTIDATLRSRMMARLTLFDEISARLPLFDALPEGAVARLAAGGFGRGLLTAAIRARLRKAGFLEMGMLAQATPAGLMAVRKIGPVRVGAIRAHLLGELARFMAGARAMHDQDATDRRRLDRLHAIPADWFPPGPAGVDKLGPSWKDVVLMRRAEAGPMLGASAMDLDEIVSALSHVLGQSEPRPRPAMAAHEDDVTQDAGERRDRAALLRERDREWDEAAPVRDAQPGRRGPAS